MPRRATNNLSQSGRNRTRDFAQDPRAMHFPWVRLKSYDGVHEYASATQRTPTPHPSGSVQFICVWSLQVHPFHLPVITRRSSRVALDRKPAPASPERIGQEWRCLRAAAPEHNENRIVNFWAGVSYFPRPQDPSLGICACEGDGAAALGP